MTFSTRQNHILGTGFTLAEVIVVTLLFAVLLSIVLGIFLANNRFYQNQSGKILAVNATREAADRLNEFSRVSVEIVSSFVYGSITYTTNNQRVIFKVPSVDSNQNILTGQYDYVVIGAKPTNTARLELIISPTAGSSRLSRELLLSQNLTSINLTYDNADPTLARRVTYFIQVTEPGRNPVAQAVNGSATMRNR